MVCKMKAAVEISYFLFPISYFLYFLGKLYFPKFPRKIPTFPNTSSARLQDAQLTGHAHPHHRGPAMMRIGRNDGTLRAAPP